MPQQKQRKILIGLIKNRGIQVLLSLFLYFFLAPFLPTWIHQLFYTISLFIKDILLWVLPFAVCFFIAYALSSFEKKATLFILILFLFEAISNSLSVWYAYGWGHLTVNHLPSIEISSVSDNFVPLWRFPFFRPSWWSADKGTFLGIFLGMIASFNFSLLKKIIIQGREKSQWLLINFFSRLIPLFILGFVARMYQTQLLSQLVNRYFELILWLLLILFIYIAFLFLIGSGFNFRVFFRSTKNLLPATGLAFSSGCSLSTMPWTIEGTAKNLINPELAKTIIPATTNIQQIGDCIANTFLCFLIYYHYNGYPPSPSVWLLFSTIFVLARFATAAVIGGAIFIMLPIYESYLGFNAEMIAMILALNVILDPLITCTNVIANGALCRIFERIWICFNRSSERRE
jgi:Na+/H+-dicarboxylate symporter